MLVNLEQLLPVWLTLSAFITLGIMILTIWALVAEIRPPEVILVCSCFAFMLFGILTPAQVFEGFSMEIIPLIGLLCVMVRAMELHGILEWFGRRALTDSKNYFIQLGSLIIPTGVMSAFFNNTLVVLIMTPLVRRWALKKGNVPSQYLMAISYASILGGSCTLIGSSTNLIVQSLLLNTSSISAFSFFEIGKVGVPLFLIGALYLMVTMRFLPKREDPTKETTVNIDSMLARYLVDKGSPLVGKNLKELEEGLFRGVALLEVFRKGDRLYSPGGSFRLEEEDLLLFASDLHRLAELHNIEGLTSYTDPGIKLSEEEIHFIEIIVPITSLMVGKTINELRFRKNYGASILAIYREGKQLLKMIRDVPLKAGDTLIAISDAPERLEAGLEDNFYVINTKGKLHTLNRKPGLIALGCFISMVLATMIGFPMLYSSSIAVSLLLLLGVISIKEAVKSVIWMVLLMIACSFALGKALVVTGLSGQIASMLLSVVGNDPRFVLGGVLLMTIILTEFLSNNSTAIIMFPIALGMLYQIGYYTPESIKAISAAILVGSSTGYALPTGYQTHMIVYGSGGYKFRDFIIRGIPLDLLTFAVGVVLIPWVFPMVKG